VSSTRPDAEPTWDVSSGDPTTIGAALADAFRRQHGRDPDGVFAAPGRVNLIGEHTDYNGGLCLPIALPHATYVAVGRRPDRRLQVTSKQQADSFAADWDRFEPTGVTGWPAYVVGVLWALGKAGIPLPGMDLVIDSRVPVGSGLSSSAALECAVALGAYTVAGVDLDDAQRHRLIDACIRAERDVVGAPTGGMDQTIAVFGQAGHALLIDFADGHLTQVPWAVPEVEVLVVDTRATHALNDGQYGSRRAQCEQAAKALGVNRLSEVPEPEAALHRLDDELRPRARHVFTENARVRAAVQALQEQDPVELGRLFTASHASLRDDFQVSCPELDVAVEAAVAAGAYGARMTGGGFGGSAIALVHPDQVAVARAAVLQAFGRQGFTPPRFLLALPSQGARRL
jgi:galactokinase